ncbi:hypothetical protein J4467_00490 [Candidatus Woesearchaeota archaeon]|nr:hypothetical protein [Candidatus Woesearchaeota archaeon]
MSAEEEWVRSRKDLEGRFNQLDYYVTDRSSDEGIFIIGKWEHDMPIIINFSVDPNFVGLQYLQKKKDYLGSDYRVYSGHTRLTTVSITDSSNIDLVSQSMIPREEYFGLEFDRNSVAQKAYADIFTIFQADINHLKAPRHYRTLAPVWLRNY